MLELPLVSDAEAVRVFKRLEFALSLKHGSHIVLRRGCVACVVPNHKELKKGTLAGILKQAGVSPDDFISA